MRERSKSPVYRSETRKNRSSTPMMSSDDEFGHVIDQHDHDRDHSRKEHDHLLKKRSFISII